MCVDYTAWFPHTWTMEIAAHTIALVRDTFAAKEVATVLDLLREYGAESSQPEPDRVHRAIIKLGQGDLDQVRRYLRIAKSDYRDVLYYSGDY
ncbi:hypothetical protein [Parafrankia sp. FMc2]|uniref:hypothetical protein n=1 Tax=Parafrankia sp. FMc2 TaxID=3233196 RepID=UPI0034D63C7D